MARRRGRADREIEKLAEKLGYRRLASNATNAWYIHSDTAKRAVFQFTLDGWLRTAVFYRTDGSIESEVTYLGSEKRDRAIKLMHEHAEWSEIDA